MAPLLRKMTEKRRRQSRLALGSSSSQDVMIPLQILKPSGEPDLTKQLSAIESASPLPSLPTEQDPKSVTYFRFHEEDHEEMDKRRRLSFAHKFNIPKVITVRSV